MSMNDITLQASSIPVKSATIFQSSRAELMRSLTLDLKSGRNVVEIYGISYSIDVDSPRISGAPGDVQVLDVVCTRKPDGPAELYEGAASAEIKTLQATGRALKAERELRQQQLNLLDESARMVTAHPKDLGGTQEPVQLLDFVDRFAERKLGVQKALQSLDERIVSHEKSVAIKLARLARKGEATAVIKATILAKRDCKVDLRLTYLVSGVEWTPFYDLHATMVDGKPSSSVLLRYCAIITQSTGEDWTDTTLTLSTATSQSLKRPLVPSVEPIKIRRVLNQASEKDQQLQRALSILARHSGIGTAANQASGMHPLAKAPPPAMVTRANGSGVSVGLPVQSVRAASFFEAQPPPISQSTHALSTSGPSGPVASAAQQMQQVQAQEHSPPGPTAEPFELVDTVTSVQTDEIVHEWAAPSRSSLAVTYRVEGAVSLPSDGKQHKLTVTTLDLDAEHKSVCVPRQTQTVFIVSSVKNTSEYELLPGVVNVFMDDGFVTKTSLGHIATGESFGCMLGISAVLKVTYEQSTKTEHEPRRNFAEPYKTTTRTVRTTITNQQGSAVDALVVRDAIPLVEEEHSPETSITLRKPVGLAEAKDGQDVVVQLGEGAEGQGRGTATVRWMKVTDGKGGEKDGLYEWVCAVPAKGKITLEAQWDVKAPSNVQWFEVAPPPFRFVPS